MMSLEEMNAAERLLLQSAFQAGYSVSLNRLLDGVVAAAKDNNSIPYVRACKDVSDMAVRLLVEPPSYEDVLAAARAKREVTT
jgi:hypothetical protein